MLKVYIGWDPAAVDAYRVAEKSLRRHASIPLDVTPLRSETLAAAGLLRRPTDARGGLYDLHSQSPASTEFAISRFLVPLLAQSGLALFVDCDMVFLGDVAEMIELANPENAVQVVKHKFHPLASTKMIDKVQTAYPCKGWSSVCLFNASHIGNRRLSLDAINHRPGRDLHSFFWLADSEIGQLPSSWNWLVGVQPRPEKVNLAHFTLGGPWINNWQPAPHDDIWLSEASDK